MVGGNLIERDVFYVVRDEEDLGRVRTGSIKCQKCEDTERNVLGSSETGIHFSKHLDVVLRNEYKKRARTVYCVLIKVNKGFLMICLLFGRIISFCT